MPVELVIDIENKENYNSLLKEKVTIQDATKVSFICKECNKKTVVKSFYNWRKRSSVFICGKCKTLKTRIDKYGSIENANAERQRKLEESNLKKMLKTKDENHSWGRKIYLYNGVHYDSSWEIMFVIFCEENNIKVKRNECFYFEYYDNEKKHRYFPDFIAEDGHFIEIKGTHLLGKNPFNLKDSRSVAKYQCMIDNDVEILSGEFFAPLLKKYPKRFFKKFRVN